jgi:alanyl-tRNA synthetase
MVSNEADVSEGVPKKLSGNEIREMFLAFFESKKGSDGKGHRRVRSSSLVPHGDPTLLFTNAGMNQFKDVFLGLEKRDYTRAASAQKCVRAGGKHNDLENVGFTKRHHTFFEMLGNFSFGDYFKNEAIAYAWELLTSPQWFAIPKDKLYVTIFGGAEVAPGTQLGVDEEAKKFWLEQSVPAERIVPLPGLEDNFWQMGDTGPCGPCSETHYDMGPEASEDSHTDCKFPCDCGRYVEIWNLVFMQFNRDVSGALTPLPKPCVDTGMGLERVAAVLQGVISNYETDLFVPLIEYANSLIPDRRGNDSVSPISLPAFRIIADHARASTFLISDGVVPSNDGRGYVLRKILRRAIRHSREIGAREPILHKMVVKVRDLMASAYPELNESIDRVSRVVLAEEERFSRTLELGTRKLEEVLKAAHEERSAELWAMIQEAIAKDPTGDLKALAMDPSYLLQDSPSLPETVPSAIREKFREVSDRRPILKGELAFQLTDTFGLPRDFIEDATRDQGVTFDVQGFESALLEQRSRSRASWKGVHKEAANPAYAKLAETFRTEPDFYSATRAKDCRIESIITKSGSVSELKAGESGEVVLDRTPIYAESGGQMADTGGFYDASSAVQLAEVSGAYYPVAGLVAHRVKAKETLRVGDRVTVVADAERRARIMRNHTGTHLVHAALRNILGTHVKQAGSLNAPERLRFDFSHFAPVGQEELRDIEQQANEEIRLNTQIETGVMSLEEALNSGALAFFGDKYPESNVRVVTIPDPNSPRGFYSKELCGGTHVTLGGDIGVLKIVSEESVAAGVRRIEAVTGIGAIEHYQNQAHILRALAGQLNVGEDGLLASVEKLIQTARHLEKELSEQKRKGALHQLDELFGQAHTVKGVKVVASEVASVDREGLRQLVDSLRQKLGSGVVALGMAEDGKVALIAGVTKDLTAKVHAGKLIQALAKQVGGSGGGRADLAEAGGKDTSALKSALQSVPSLIEALL